MGPSTKTGGSVGSGSFVSAPLRLYDTMKSFVWFTTLLLLCIELAHAAHLAPITGHRHHRRTPPKSTARGLKRRANRSCTPPASSNGTSPGQVNAANGGGFPSLGFNMPDSVPSSVDGWWSDYKAEVGFLGFSYSVSGCASIHKSLLPLIRNLTLCSSRPDFQARVLAPLRANSKTSEPGSTADMFACTVHVTETGFSAFDLFDRPLCPSS